jgi:hypothetical protein
VRLFFLALLTSLGIVTASAELRAPARLDVQVAERALMQGSTDTHAEHAPPLQPMVRVIVRQERTTPPRIDDPSGFVVGRSIAWTLHGDLAPHSAIDPPCACGPMVRRQPEGRGPPGRPIAA